MNIVHDFSASLTLANFVKTGRSLPQTDKLILIHDTYVWLESTQQRTLFPRLQGISADPQATGDDISRKTCQAWIQLRHQLNPQYRLQLGCLIQAFLSIVCLRIVEGKMDSQWGVPSRWSSRCKRKFTRFSQKPRDRHVCFLGNEANKPEISVTKHLNTRITKTIWTIY